MEHSSTTMSNSINEQLSGEQFIKNCLEFSKETNLVSLLKSPTFDQCVLFSQINELLIRNIVQKLKALHISFTGH